VVTETVETLSDAAGANTLDDIFAFDGAARRLATELLSKTK
jgi:hypothetical protein